MPSELLKGLISLVNSWASRIEAQPMFDVLSLAADKERQGHYVARMEIGDTPGFRNEFVHELLAKNAQLPFRYSPSGGETALIEKVLETQWPDLNGNVNNVVIAPANFLITAALASITKPGDIVLIPDPGFPSYKLSATFLGLKIIHYPVYSQNGAQFPNLDDFCKENGLRPDVVIVNNPSNPLGVAFEVEKIRNSLVELVNKGTKIIYDETYVNLVYDGTQVSEKSLPAIRIRSFSKEHCAPGLRIGYVHASPSEAKIISNFVSLTISCSPKFIQQTIAEYLGSKESFEFTSQVRTQMSKRFAYLESKIPSKLLLTKPNAAFYALIEMGSSEESFRFLLEKNVSTCPGTKFGEQSEGVLRLSLAGSSDTFEKDVEMLASGIKDWLEVKKV
jgi:aspartate aminotransferase